MNLSTNEEYLAQIERQKIRATKWLQDHPAARVEIVWPKIPIIATIGDALKHGFVRANQDGRKLISALIEGETEADEPTIQMVRESL